MYHILSVSLVAAYNVATFVLGQIVLDQLRTIEKTRLVKRHGRVAEAEQQAVLQTLSNLFAP